MNIPTIRDNAKLKLYMLIVFGSALCGYLIVKLFQTFNSTWAVFATLALLTPFVLAVVGDTKRFLWAALTMLLPISVDITLGHQGHIGDADGFVISAFDIILAALYIIWILEIVQKKRKTRFYFYPAFSVPAILLIIAAALSSIGSSLPLLSWIQIIQIIKIYLCFIYLANNVKDEKDYRFMIAWLIAGLLFEGVIGFLQHRYGEPFWPLFLGGPRWIDHRIRGTWMSPNDCAWYLTFVLPIALSALFSKINNYQRILIGIVFFTGCGALMWTNSRGGWISMAAAGAFVLAFTFSKIKGKYALVKTVMAIMVVAIIISPLYPRLFFKLQTRLEGNDRGSAESRLPQFEVAYAIIKDHPYIGIGINNYTDVMHEYDTTEEGLESITRHPVHNIYLLIFAEMGILGFFLFLWLILSFYMQGLKRVVTRDAFMTYGAIGMMGGVIAFLIHGLVDTATYGSKLYLFIFYFAALIVGPRHEIQAEKLYPAA